jgi:hypothetical protein
MPIDCGGTLGAEVGLLDGVFRSRIRAVGAALSGDDSGDDDGASDAVDALGLTRRMRLL